MLALVLKLYLTAARFEAHHVNELTCFILDHGGVPSPLVLQRVVQQAIRMDASGLVPAPTEDDDLFCRQKLVSGIAEKPNGLPSKTGLKNTLVAIDG